MKALIWIGCCLFAGTAIGLINVFEVPFGFILTLIIGGGAISVAVALCEQIDEKREEKKRKEEIRKNKADKLRRPPSF